MRITRRRFAAAFAALSAGFVFPGKAASYTTRYKDMEPFLRGLHPHQLVRLHQQTLDSVSYLNRVGHARIATARQTIDAVERVAAWDQVRVLYTDSLPFAQMEARELNPLIETILRDHGLRYDPASEQFRRTAP